MTANKTSKTSFFSWFIWGIAAVFFFLQYVARVAPSVMVPQLMHDFSVSAFALGGLTVFFYYAYVIMQIPVGVLLDRYGSRRLLTIATLSAALGCFAFAGAHKVYMGEFGRLLIGFGASFSFIGALKLAADWFPAERFGLLAGSTQALGMLGAVVGEIPIAFAVRNFGWRHAILFLAFSFIVLSTLIFLIIRDHPSKIQEAAKKEKPLSLWKSLLAVCKNPLSWANGIYVGFAYATITGFGALWGVSFLQRVYHLPIETAGTAVSTIFIGWMLGGPITGWLSDHFRKRKPVMLFTVLLCAIIFATIIYVPGLPIFMLFALLFLLGASNSGAAVSYAYSKEINHPKISGTSVAFANMASVLIGMCCQPLIGWLLDFNWGGKMIHGIRYYSTGDFRWAMTSLLTCYLVAFVFILFMRETHCKNISKLTEVME
ncbi:MAG: MFS transporter [Gammaproteobacteria bacterium]|nr:MFS transporter [Gammaproteobacteria bacterium]